MPGLPRHLVQELNIGTVHIVSYEHSTGYNSALFESVSYKIFIQPDGQARNSRHPTQVITSFHNKSKLKLFQRLAKIQVRCVKDDQIHLH